MQRPKDKDLLRPQTKKIMNRLIQGASISSSLIGPEVSAQVIESLLPRARGGGNLITSDLVYQTIFGVLRGV